MPPERTVEVVVGGGGEEGRCLDVDVVVEVEGRGGEGMRREARELGFPWRLVSWVVWGEGRWGWGCKGTVCGVLFLCNFRHFWMVGGC